MSLYKVSKSPFYQYDFIIHGTRFTGSTKTANKGEALKVERELKVQARLQVEQLEKTGKGPLTLDIAAGRFFTEVGQYHAAPDTTWRDLNRLISYFGKDKRLDQITDNDVAALVAWRRSQKAKGKKDPIAPATVNRSTTDMLKALFGRAKRAWRYTFPNEPNWAEHRLKTPEERVRELHEGEGEALNQSMRDDFKLWLEFARLTALRLNETLLKWEHVNFFAKVITTVGKGGLIVRTPITPQVKAILDQCKGHHSEWVFTYVARQTRKGRIKGKRYPITYENAKTVWRRSKADSGVQDFRFHDFRHDLGTKLLRQSGNLKLVQKALNHRNIKTTLKYAHVLGR